MNRHVSSNDRIKAGRSIINQNQNERVFKRGTLMFIEGESSAEMFIVRTGKIRVLKQEGEYTVELAVLGPGSVLGELALLDNQPRSATAQVLEDTVATVINEDLFGRTLQGIPTWLRDLINMVTKRLRNTMERCSSDIINKSVSGVIRIILSLNESEGNLVDGLQAVSLQRVKETIYSITGLGGNEAETVFLHLILKEMMVIRKDMFGQEHVIIKDPEVMLLYMNFIRARQCGRSLAGERLSENALETIRSILLSAERDDRKEGKVLSWVSVAELEKEFSKKKTDCKIPEMLNELATERLIIVKDNGIETDNDSKRVIYNAETLRRICCLRDWLPVFKEEVRY